MIDSDTNLPHPVGRLAPSPTGVLHIGNARSFLLAWLSIRKRQGTLLMRIEDIDSPRVVASAETAVVEDLRWLGLDWDGPIIRQSERLPLYQQSMRDLIQKNLAYPCTCTRKDIGEAASAPHENLHEGPIYPGTCLGKFESLEQAEEQTGKPAAFRFHSCANAMPWVDRFLGLQNGTVNGDFVVQKKDGQPAYQLAVVVDDAAQGITEVLRADDLVTSTPRQIMIYDALGLTPPEFVHVPLVVGPDGLRLAKRHGDTSLAYFRSRGVSPQEIVGLLAMSCGLRRTSAPCVPKDLLMDFDLAKLPTSPFVFEDNMLLP